MRLITIHPAYAHEVAIGKRQYIPFPRLPYLADVRRRSTVKQGEMLDGMQQDFGRRPRCAPAQYETYAIRAGSYLSPTVVPMVYGAIVAVVTVVDAESSGQLPAEWGIVASKYGGYWWKLENVRALRTAVLCEYAGSGRSVARLSEKDRERVEAELEIK